MNPHGSFVLILCTLMFLSPKVVYGQEFEQWYTGSLLSPSGALFHRGDTAIEPYLSAQLSNANFDKAGRKQRAGIHSRRVVNDTLYKYAITNNLSMQALPDVSLWQSEGRSKKSAPSIGDLPIDVVVRFLDINWGYVHPAFNLFVGAGFPTGRYDDLRDPRLSVGRGAYMGRFALTEQSSYRTRNGYQLRIRLWLNARQPLGAFAVHGISAYGSQSGRVVLGMTAEAGGAVELAITRRFVLAVDIDHDYAAAGRFYLAGPKTLHTMHYLSSSSSWNVAPALEYNWSDRFGVIAGASVVCSGRNTSASIVPQFAFNAFF